MSVTLDDLKELIAEDLPSELHVTNIREGSQHWFIGVGDSYVEAVPGLSPFVVDKETGKISNPMPSVPYFVSGEEPLPIEIEEQNAVQIDLSVLEQ